MTISPEAMDDTDISNTHLFINKQKVLITSMVYSYGTGTTQFYTDKGANLGQFGDRLFLGGAAANSGSSVRGGTTGTDWLTEVMAATPIGGYAVFGATTASLTKFGTIGVLGASSTQQASTSAALLGYTPASIGVASWGIDNDTSATRSTTAWAYYGEAWRLSGVTYKPSFCMELNAVSFGTAPVGSTTPYNINIGGGVYGIQLASGGGQTAGTGQYQVGAAQAAMTITSNPTAFSVGIEFSATGLVGTNGNDTGYAEAIGLAKQQVIAWHTPETVSGTQGANTGAYIRSTVSLGADQVSMNFTDAAVTLSNAVGSTLLSVVNASTITNYLEIETGNGTQAAGIYVVEGSNGSANLGLFPASGGELQISSAVTATGATAAAIPAYGFLHINVNGTECRVPLFSPTQAGS